MSSLNVKRKPPKGGIFVMQVKPEACLMWRNSLEMQSRSFIRSARDFWCIHNTKSSYNYAIIMSD